MGRTPKYPWSDGMKALEKILIGGINILEKQHKNIIKKKAKRKKD